MHTRRQIRRTLLLGTLILTGLPGAGDATGTEAAVRR